MVTQIVRVVNIEVVKIDHNIRALGSSKKGLPSPATPPLPPHLESGGLVYAVLLELFAPCDQAFIADVFSLFSDEQ